MPGIGVYDNPISLGSWTDVFSQTTRWILSITVSVILLFLIVGGLFYITSAGDQERMAQGKRIIIAALIGFLIIILSFSLITELKNIL